MPNKEDTSLSLLCGAKATQLRRKGSRGRGKKEEEELIRCHRDQRRGTFFKRISVQKAWLYAAAKKEKKWLMG